MAQASIISKYLCKYFYFIISWIRNDELIIFTKTKEVEFIPTFPISVSPSYIIIISFHLHDRTMWIIIIVHVHWTKLESANILFKRRRQGNMDSLLDQWCKWEPLNIFIAVFSSVWLNKKKRNSKKHTELFLEFLVFSYTSK